MAPPGTGSLTTTQVMSLCASSSMRTRSTSPRDQRLLSFCWPALTLRVAVAMSAYAFSPWLTLTEPKLRSDSMSASARRTASVRWRAMSEFSRRLDCTRAIVSMPSDSTRKATSASSSVAPRARRNAEADAGFMVQKSRQLPGTRAKLPLLPFNAASTAAS